MPYKEKEIEKLYYSIGEVAKMYNVADSTIRYWENEFDVLKPRRKKKGDRLFTKKDLENLKVIHYLLKDQLFTIEGAKKKLKERKKALLSHAESVEELKKLKSFLLDLKKRL